MTGRPPALLAYPYGASSAAVRRAARRAGYRAAFGTRPVLNNMQSCDLFDLGRFDVRDDRILEACSLEDIEGLLGNRGGDTK
jgi:peptidoglycan/xylan/chitin deacetylase (PgdA/CDA1 family)